MRASGEGRREWKEDGGGAADELGNRATEGIGVGDGGELTAPPRDCTPVDDHPIPPEQTNGDDLALPPPNP